MTWLSADIRYSPERDSIELVGPDGEVMAIIHRNMVIRMLGMLPSEPPCTANEQGRNSDVR